MKLQKNGAVLIIDGPAWFPFSHTYRVVSSEPWVGGNGYRGREYRLEMLGQGGEGAHYKLTVMKRYQDSQLHLEAGRYTFAVTVRDPAALTKLIIGDSHEA